MAHASAKKGTKRNGSSNGRGNGRSRSNGINKVDVLIEKLERDMDRQKQQSNTYILRQREFSRLSAQERTDFLNKAYAIFAKHYDKYMEESGHYTAIRTGIRAFARHLRFPILDPSTGTAMMLKTVLHMMIASEHIHKVVESGIPDEVDGLVEPFGGDPTMVNTLLQCLPHPSGGEFYPVQANRLLVQANDSSQTMIDIAQNNLEAEVATLRRLFGYPSTSEVVGFNLYDVSEGSPPRHFHKRFRTILCSQTFHVVHDVGAIRRDEALARFIHHSLADGGKALIFEEFPYKLLANIGASSDHLEKVLRLLQTAITPYEGKRSFLSTLERNDLRFVEEIKTPIDNHHKMHGFVFIKRSDVGRVEEDPCLRTPPLLTDYKS